MFKEFKEFALRGNVVDMSVGIIVGGAFGTIVSTLVSDILMPPLGLLTGGVDFSNLYLILKEGVPAGPYAALAKAKTAGAVTLNYGLFLNALVSFSIVSFSVFILVKAINRLRRKEDEAPAPPSKKSCPYCLTQVPQEATRCPACTSTLEGGASLK